jgi:RNA polymerase sigma factor (sigma-70 family)
MTASNKEHLSQISTHWSLVFRAHQDTGAAKKAAQEELLQRYLGPVYCYVLSMVRDEEAARELCQEFGLHFVRGDFHRACPDEGHFRHFIKKAVRNLVADWLRRQKSRGQRLDSAVLEDLASSEPDAEQMFHDKHQADLIERAWNRLAEFEVERKDRWLYTLFRYGAEHPDQTAAEIADQLGRHLKVPLTEANVWQTLKRARAKFAALLLDEVARSLASPTPEQLREEVIDLGLLSYCELALAQRQR